MKSVHNSWDVMWFRFILRGFTIDKFIAYMVLIRKIHIYVLIENNVVLRMMTSSNGNIFRVTGHLCGEFNGPRWLPHTMASDAELWCFLLSDGAHVLDDIETTLVSLKLCQLKWWDISNL